MSSSRLRGRLVAAGYGGVGPATPAPHPDLFVALVVDVDATAPLTGVDVGALELVDATGGVVARATSARALRRDSKAVTDDARRKGDFSELGTTAFDGRADPERALRILIRAPLDVRAESLRPEPARLRLRLVAPGDPGVAIEGPVVGPWPTG